MKKNITLEEALKLMDAYPDEDDFICENIQRSLVGGEYNDNSIELSDYWRECKSIVKEYIFHRYG